MALRINPLALFIIILILCTSPLALIAGSIQQGDAEMHESFMPYKTEEVEVKKKMMMMMNRRKLMSHSTADYDDAGPNPKHDPRRRPGGKP